MNYRALDSSGDCTFGQSSFLTDSPAAVGQACMTRILQPMGSWFLDTNAGTDYSHVLGYGARLYAPAVITERVRKTEGVTGVSNISFSYDPATRASTYSCLIQTQYSQQPIEVLVNI